MLTKVDMRSEQGVLLSLPLEDMSSGYRIEDIQGLDPVAATLVSSSFAQLDGTQYHSAKRGNRNIILKLGYEPDYVNQTVATLRNALYEFLMPKSQVHFQFFTDNLPTVAISGRVETMDAPLFVQDPNAIGSIVCFDSDFVALTNETVPGVTTSGSDETDVLYRGTIETGFLFKLTVNRTLSQFTINQRLPDNTLRQLEFIGPLAAGDVLEISTFPGNKGAWRIRSGVRTSMLYAVSPYANWINLFKGLNKIRVQADGAAIPYTIEYANRYGGL